MVTISRAFVDNPKIDSNLTFNLFQPFAIKIVKLSINTKFAFKTMTTSCDRNTIHFNAKYVVDEYPITCENILTII